MNSLSSGISSTKDAESQIEHSESLKIASASISFALTVGTRATFLVPLFRTAGRYAKQITTTNGKPVGGNPAALKK
jgi:hypothetical protein